MGPFKTNKIAAYELYNKFSSIVYSMLLAVPASVSLFILPEIIVSLLFERGESNSFSTYNTSMALKAFSIGLIAFILIKILTPIYFANENSKLPLNFAMVTVILNTALSIYLFISYGFIGIAVATSVSSWVNVLLLYFYLMKKDYFIHSKKIFTPIFIILLISAILGIYLFILKNIYLSFKFSNFFYEVLFFLTIIFSGIVIYFVMISFYKPFNYVNLRNKIFNDE